MAILGQAPQLNRPPLFLFPTRPPGEVELGVSLWVSSLTLRFLWDCMGPTRGTTDVRLGCASSLSHRWLDFGEQKPVRRAAKIFIYIYIYLIIAVIQPHSSKKGLRTSSLYYKQWASARHVCWLGNAPLSGWQLHRVGTSWWPSWQSKGLDFTQSISLTFMASEGPAFRGEKEGRMTCWCVLAPM